MKKAYLLLLILLKVPIQDVHKTGFIVIIRPCARQWQVFCDWLAVLKANQFIMILLILLLVSISYQEEESRLLLGCSRRHG